MADDLETELIRDTLQRRRQMKQEGNSRYRGGSDVDNLIRICTNSLQDKTNPKALFIRASSLMKKGLYEEAIKDCETLIKADPTHAGAYYLRGSAYEKLGE